MSSSSREQSANIHVEVDCTIYAVRWMQLDLLVHVDAFAYRLSFGRLLAI